jgi:hypothetical protein
MLQSADVEAYRHPLARSLRSPSLFVVPRIEEALPQVSTTLHQPGRSGLTEGSPILLRATVTVYDARSTLRTDRPIASRCSSRGVDGIINVEDIARASPRLEAVIYGFANG